MAPDEFVGLWIGVYWEFAWDDDSQRERIEAEDDPRQVAANRHGLDRTWWSDKAKKRGYLAVGKYLAQVGDGDGPARLDIDYLKKEAKRVEKALAKAGLTGEVRLLTYWSDVR